MPLYGPPGKVIRDEGVNLAQAPYLDFTGAGVSAATAAGVTTVTVAAGATGALILLEQHTASASSTLDFTSFISATYETYVFEFVSLVPSTGLTLGLRCSTDGGATYDTTAIYDSADYVWSGAGSLLGGATSQTSCNVYPHAGRTMATTAGKAMSGTLHMYAPGAAYAKNFLGSFLGPDSATSGPQRLDINLIYQSTTAVNAIRFLVSTGNIASGTIRVYGVVKT